MYCEKHYTNKFELNLLTKYNFNFKMTSINNIIKILVLLKMN